MNIFEREFWYLEWLQAVKTGDFFTCNCKLFRADLLYQVAKKVPDLTGLCVMKVVNGTKLILDDQENQLGSFRISLDSFRSFRGPLIHKPVTGQILFLPLGIKNRLYFLYPSFDQPKYHHKSVMGNRYASKCYWRPL